MARLLIVITRNHLAEELTLSPSSNRGLAIARSWQAPAPALTPLPAPARTPLPAQAKRPRGPLTLRLSEASDVTAARRDGRAYAGQLGFDGAECALIAAVISELGRALAGTSGGELCIRAVRAEERRGIEMEAAGGGREIDLENLGRGPSLTMVRRFADELELATHEGGGARVRATKWLR